MGATPADDHEIVTGIEAGNIFTSISSNAWTVGCGTQVAAINLGAQTAGFIPHENFVIFFEDGEMDPLYPKRLIIMELKRNLPVNCQFLPPGPPSDREGQRQRIRHMRKRPFQIGGA